jgi:hypothetical protein
MSNLANRMHFEFRSYPSASSPEGILFNYPGRHFVQLPENG